MSSSSAPLVSVVIPLYNKAAHIGRALASVRAQTFEEYEIIVVDDGSTDGGGDLARRYLTARDRLIRQENAGEGAARNSGIEAARCELIAFLDADDEWLPPHLDHLVDLSRRYPEAALLATGHCVVSRNVLTVEHRLEGQEPRLLGAGEWFDLAVPGLMIPNSSSSAVRKLAAQAVGGFPVGEQFGADGDFWCRLCLRFPFALHPAVSSVYHLGTANQVTTQYRWDERPPPHVRTLIAKLQAHEVPRGFEASVARYLAESIRAHVLGGVGSGQYTTARRVLDELVDSAPAVVQELPRLRRLRVTLRSVPGPLLRLYLRLSSSHLSLLRWPRRHGMVIRVVARGEWSALVGRMVADACSGIFRLRRKDHETQ